MTQDAATGAHAMTYDPLCVRLAEKFLRDYQLSDEEHEEEVDRLAQAIQRTVEAELDPLAHRLKV